MAKLCRLVGGIALGVALFLPMTQAEPVPDKPGLAVTYYGNPTFLYVAGSFETNSLSFQQDLSSLPWPATNYDPAKGPVFIRDQGWSATLTGRLKVTMPGLYCFAQDGSLAELWVNGRRAGLDGKTAVTLPAGNVPIKLYVKFATPPQNWTMKVHLTWQASGSPALLAIDPSLLSHTQTDVDSKAAFQFDYPLVKGTTSLYNYREYAIDAPQDGCYEFIAHFDSIPGNTILWLDGKQIFYLQPRAGVEMYGLEFRNNARVTRYLTKGRHVVRLHTNIGYPWEDNIDRVLVSSRFGVNRVASGDPEQTRSIIVKDRDDMVFRKGEPLTLRIEQATEAPVTYEMQVRKQRGGGAALWTGRIALKGHASRTAGEIAYPCHQAEGGFEVSVTDGTGKVVAGPWAFVVVDTTPVPLPTADKGYQEQKVLVDSVDCLLPSDPEHKFRDNGTSKVIESTVGKYRVTGDRGTFDVAYIQDQDKQWRKTAPGENATARFAGMDWFAYTLKVKHPGRPHLVVVEFPNDVRRLISVFAFDPVTGLPHTGLIESGDAPAAAPFGQGRFMAWPNTNTLDVIAINSGTWASSLNRQTAVRRIELYELPAGIPVNPMPVAGWKSDKEFGWSGEQMDLGMEQLTMPKVWEGNEMVPGNGALWPIGYYDWEALFTVWDRCGQYAANRGANLLCWVVYDYGRSMIQNAPRTPRLREGFSTGWKARLVDPFEREQFKMMLLLCEKYRLRFVMDFMMQRLDADQILATDTKKQYDKEGLFVNDRYCLYLPNPAHPLVKQYMVDLVGEYARQYGKYEAFGGVYTRQWGAAIPQNLDCWYSSDLTGYDDFSIKAFEKETGIAIPVSEAGAKKKEMRRDWILANIKEPWLTWRCRKCLELREAMTAEIQKYAPKARMYSMATPTREAGLDPAHVKGRRDLGYGNRANYINPNAHIEIARPDPVEFANFDVREPASLRRSLTNLLPDTAFYNVSGREYPYGFYAADSAIRVHPYQLKEPAEALAACQMETIFCSGTWVLPPMDEGLRKFAQVWRAIPDLPYRRLGDTGKDAAPAADNMMVCWQARTDSGIWPFTKHGSVFYLVNRTAHPQTVLLTLDEAVSSVRDLVSGQEVATGSTAQVTVDAYMPAVFKATGGGRAKRVAGVRQVDIVMATDAVAALQKQVEHLRAMAPQAEGLVQTMPGRGEKYVTVKYGIDSDDREWARRDLKVAFTNLLVPVETAWSQKNYARVQDLLDTLLVDHNWFYQVCGWPEGQYLCRVPTGPYAKPRDLFPAMKAEHLVLVKMAGVPWGEVVQAPKGRATFTPTIVSAAKYEFRVWMMPGAGTNPVEVAVNGNVVGKLGVGSGKQRLAHFTLPCPLGLRSGTPEITLVSSNALTLSAIELVALPPEPIKVWSAIGVFETEKLHFEGFPQVFPPEKGIDLAAEYDGMGGKKIKWQQIDIGEDKFIQLLEKIYPYKYANGNGLAYLATWVYSPDERDTTLYYASDWFLQIWLNQTEVIHYASGPWQAYATTTVHLKAGWNVLLAKCMNGNTSWKAVFALSDPGDLRYRATPVEPTVFKAPRLKGEIKLDGVPDESAWTNAPEIKPFWGYTTGKAALAQGMTKVLWDDTYLYVAGDLKDKDLIATFTKHDECLCIHDDVLEVFLKPAQRSPQYYEIHVNPINTTFDAMYRYYGDWKDSEKYESGLETAVKVHGTVNDSGDQDEGWTFEMRIPFAALEAAGRKPPVIGDQWKFTFCRYDYTHSLPKGYQERFQSRDPKAVPFELGTVARNLDKGGFHDQAYFETLLFVE